MRSRRCLVRCLFVALAIFFVLESIEAGEFLVESDRLTLGAKAVAKSSVGEPALRVMSWNVKAGALFPSTMRNPEGEEAGARVGRFGRILRAIRPDIICLQEIWPLRKDAAILDLLNSELPLSGGADWQLHRAVDVVIASRYSLKQLRGDRVIHYPLPEMPEFHYGQALSLVDLPDDRFKNDFFVITAHFRSRSGAESIRMRESHSASILARLNDLKSPGGDIDISSGTPIVIAGDLNVYESNDDDPLRHLHMLISGDNIGREGKPSDRGPDWDGSKMTDLSPSINGQGKAFYTWRNDTLPYPPGALDRILYTDSVLEVRSAFVLDAQALSDDLRAKFGVFQSDCAFAGRDGEYDHLPMIVDFIFKEKSVSLPVD